MPTPPSGPVEVAEQNRDLIREVYAAADASDFVRLPSLMADGYTLTQADGHPVPGTWHGEEATAAATRVYAACGTTGVTVHEIIADGPNRVIGLVEAHGTDVHGRPWRMPIAECFWIENGKVTEIRPFYWDIARLRQIAGVHLT
jgi:ketosteroid isomerase-like protein